MKRYTLKADMWSVGVLLYMMITGTFPFNGNSKKDVLKSIIRGQYNFGHPAFLRCSWEVKDLITKLLVVHPDKRISAEEAYTHPWIQWQVSSEARHFVLDANVLQTISEHHTLQKFKKAVLFMIAIQILDKETNYFEKLFQTLDTSGDGVI